LYLALHAMKLLILTCLAAVHAQIVDVAGTCASLRDPRISFPCVNITYTLASSPTTSVTKKYPKELCPLLTDKSVYQVCHPNTTEWDYGSSAAMYFDTSTNAGAANLPLSRLPIALTLCSSPALGPAYHPWGSGSTATSNFLTNLVFATTGNTTVTTKTMLTVTPNMVCNGTDWFTNGKTKPGKILASVIESNVTTLPTAKLWKIIRHPRIKNAVAIQYLGTSTTDPLKNTYLARHQSAVQMQRCTLSTKIRNLASNGRNNGVMFATLSRTAGSAAEAWQMIGGDWYKTGLVPTVFGLASVGGPSMPKMYLGTTAYQFANASAPTVMMTPAVTWALSMYDTTSLISKKIAFDMRY